MSDEPTITEPTATEPAAAAPPGVTPAAAEPHRIHVSVVLSNLAAAIAEQGDQRLVLTADEAAGIARAVARTIAGFVAERRRAAAAGAPAN
jgi:hypothetical protein